MGLAKFELKIYHRSCLNVIIMKETHLLECWDSESDETRLRTEQRDNSSPPLYRAKIINLVAEKLAKLVPEGYQDGDGFHYGTPPVVGKGSVIE